MAQEAYDTHPAIREAGDRHISAHAAAVAQDIRDAKRQYVPEAPWSAESLALFTQAVIQGAFILAKAKHGPGVAAVCLSHLRHDGDTGTNGDVFREAFANIMGRNMFGGGSGDWGTDPWQGC
jgi:TetR/AcrR family transcriptional repressor of nem operon